METEVQAEEEKEETETCAERENSLKGVCTGYFSHFRNLVLFNNLKEPMLVKKPTILQKKALVLSFLELEEQGHGIIIGAQSKHIFLHQVSLVPL